MSRLLVGPFNRVEGDLEIKLDIAGGQVREAWVNSPLFRGFEHILHGKDPRDALVYTPRICGICSVSQSMAAAKALAEAEGLNPPPNGTLAQNIILAVENIADHLTHFYLFFMPDFARAVYAEEPWFADIHKRFQALKGLAAGEFLPARAEFMHILGLLAGKWPHTLALQPGGTTRTVSGAEQARILMTLTAFRRFLENSLFGSPLERVGSLASLEELEAWADEAPATSSDFRCFLHVARHLQLSTLGRAGDRFMSYGAYRFADGPAFAQGIFENGQMRLLETADITEDISCSWYANRNGPRHPSQGVTVPDADAPAGYSWCKAPRLGGKPVEVGALARQVVDGHPLARDLVAESGGNVRNRVITRLLEVARLVPMMENWVQEMRPREPFCLHKSVPEEATSKGLVEAARGALGHWVHIRKRRILNYQIIAPTTWNFSPRDGNGEPGPCERALVGAPVRRGERTPVAVQHIVRSFDPCMVCTVH